MAEPVFGVGIDDKAALAGEDDDLAAIAEAEAFRLQLARRALPADWRIARRRAFLQIDCGGFGGDFETVGVGQVDRAGEVQLLLLPVVVATTGGEGERGAIVGEDVGLGWVPVATFLCIRLLG